MVGRFRFLPEVGIESKVVRVRRERLVIGLANGWAGSPKVVLIYPEQVGEAHALLKAQGLAPRGYAFWNIQYEGKTPASNPNVQVWMAQGLNLFLDTHS